MHKTYLDFVGILGATVAAIMMAMDMDKAEPIFFGVGLGILGIVAAVAFIKTRLPK